MYTSFEITYYWVTIFTLCGYLRNGSHLPYSRYIYITYLHFCGYL